MDVDLDRLLTELLDCEIECIVVGGLAAVLHGAPITTYDLDVVPARTRSNLERLEILLEDLDAISRVRPELRRRPTVEELATDGHHLLRTRLGYLDVLGTIGDGLDFNALARTCETITYSGRPLRVQDLASLIEVKEFLAGDKDKLVLPILRAALEERQRENDPSEDPDK